MHDNRSGPILEKCAPFEKRKIERDQRKERTCNLLRNQSSARPCGQSKIIAYSTEVNNCHLHFNIFIRQRFEFVLKCLQLHAICPLAQYKATLTWQRIKLAVHSFSYALSLAKRVWRKLTHNFYLVVFVARCCVQS